MNAIVAADARDMTDPAHIVGRIPACASDEKRRSTVRLLNPAISELRAADAAKTAGDCYGYWQAMRNVFGTDYLMAHLVTNDAPWRRRPRARNSAS